VTMTHERSLKRGCLSGNDVADVAPDPLQRRLTPHPKLGKLSCDPASKHGLRPCTHSSTDWHCCGFAFHVHFCFLVPQLLRLMFLLPCLPSRCCHFCNCMIAANVKGR
jgi:hypothetical protein